MSRNIHPDQLFSLNNRVDKKDGKLVLANMIWVIIALLIGGSAGMLQTFIRAGMFELPFGIGYYQLLTLHGVILALVLTFFFIMGFQIASLSRSAGAFNDRERLLGWIGFWLMSAGTLVAAAMIATNEASVLYTFYAPLQAHAFYYIALAVIIIGTWFSVIGQLMRYFRWRR